jgi:hypothetical protein
MDVRFLVLFHDDFYADPKRQAILLVAGDKSGTSEERFYRQLIDKSDARYDAHLSALKDD